MLGSSGNLKELLEDKPKPLLMAHRGNRILFPENTIAAFKRSFADGADILETDLHLSSDGEFICIHDASVNRTTDGKGEVKDISLKDLKSLRILNSQSLPTDHSIPTLIEALRIIPEKMVLALELKTDRFLQPAVCKRLGALLKENHVLERTIALSFSLPRLLALKKTIPEIPIGWISMSRLLPDRAVDLIGVFWLVFYLNPWYVSAAHCKGMLVCPLDPTPDTRLKFYKRINVDAVLSDNPEKTRKLLDNLTINLTSEGNNKFF